MSRIINDPLPRLDQSVRERNKSMDFSFEIGELLFKGLDTEIVEKYSANYDLKINRLVIRGPKYRVAF